MPAGAPSAGGRPTQRTHEEVKDGHVHDIQDAVAAVIGGHLLHLFTVVGVHLPSVGEQYENPGPSSVCTGRAKPAVGHPDQHSRIYTAARKTVIEKDVTAEQCLEVDLCKPRAEAALTGVWGGEVVKPHHVSQNDQPGGFQGFGGSLLGSRAQHHTCKDSSAAGKAGGVSLAQGTESCIQH